MTSGPDPGVSRTYADVDASADPAEAAAWMDRVATYPAFEASKARVATVLAPAVEGGGAVLDVGCGLGEDVRALGSMAVGLDPSWTMLTGAHPRGGRFVRGDGAALPFATAALAGVRADRVLQHVADPEAVAAEMARVVAPGGVVAVIDPDQATLQVLGPDPRLAADVVRFRATVGIRHGFLAARMHEVLDGVGVATDGIERFTVDLTDPDEAFGIPTWGRVLVEAGWWDGRDAARFDATLADAAMAGHFRYVVDLVLTWGRRRGEGA
ncbi:MAG: methyltransferase domain-containing protein [Acidimicrobiia bacterium]|nr:methyltransferase domain-containing protein [Acidimicrobiia bacterium]